MINRQLQTQLEKRWATGKALVVLGPRQVGKTTLLKALCASKGNYLFLDGDQSTDRNLLSEANVERLKQIIGTHSVVLVDEAQRIKNIGLTLKIITDQFPHIQLVVSESSALELANEISEPLTGRKWEYRLYPFSWVELQNHIGYLAAQKQLETRLIYGFYPEIINRVGDEREVLKELLSSYLYRDLLQYEGIRKPQLLNQLLTALALQLGSEVSLNELSQLLQVSRITVEQYIDLLEKAFIVFRLSPLSRNLRNEITSNRKVYFYDNGIRNALLSDFKPLALRSDTGALWENFVIAERQKQLEYGRSWAKPYFWRTYQQQEIDYVEENEGDFRAFEIKWNPKAKAKFPSTFIESYQPIEKHVITPDNFTDFVSAID
ncbi:MAG: ATP-binding protein [Spirosomataceae bacterium]